MTVFILFALFILCGVAIGVFILMESAYRRGVRDGTLRQKNLTSNPTPQPGDDDAQ